jgi:hypothetical protein
MNSFDTGQASTVIFVKVHKIFVFHIFICQLLTENLKGEPRPVRLVTLTKNNENSKENGVFWGVTPCGYWCVLWQMFINI